MWGFQSSGQSPRSPTMKNDINGLSSPLFEYLSLAMWLWSFPTKEADYIFLKLDFKFVPGIALTKRILVNVKWQKM